MPLAPPTTAYDLELLQTPPARGTDSDHGWCYGLPPGITESQWPLSRCDGFPMQPCFTLRLPEQYRTRGADYIALTMFADQQHDEPSEIGSDRGLSRRIEPRSVPAIPTCCRTGSTDRTGIRWNS